MRKIFRGHIRKKEPSGPAIKARQSAYDYITRIALRRNCTRVEALSIICKRDAARVRNKKLIPPFSDAIKKSAADIIGINNQQGATNV